VAGTRGLGDAEFVRCHPGVAEGPASRSIPPAPRPSLGLLLVSSLTSRSDTEGWESPLLPG